MSVDLYSNILYWYGIAQENHMGTVKYGFLNIQIYRALVVLSIYTYSEK